MRHLAILLFVAQAPLAAQGAAPRSGDYLFAAGVDDARAVWVNPAGLAAFLEASVHGEIVLTRPAADPFQVGQWTAGFNSRGLALAYQRDLHATGDAVDAIRVGSGVGFHGGAVGGAITLYRSDDRSARGLDLGLRYAPLPRVVLAAVVRHVGRPTVRDAPLPLTGVAGAVWSVLPARVQLGAEALAIERLVPDSTGWDVRYRAGLRVSSRGRVPVGALTALNLGSNLRIDRWTIGVAIGGHDQAIVTGSVLPLVGGSRHADALSLTGVASRRPPGRQF